MEPLDIVMFSYADWLGMQSTPQHLARLLAGAHRVLLVDMPHSIFRFLKEREQPGLARWRGPCLQQVQPALWVYHPPHRFLPVGGLPYPVSRTSLRINGSLLAHRLAGVLRRLQFERPVLWSFSPVHGGAGEHLPRRLMVHDICDEWANYLSHPGDRRLVDEMDRRLAEEADIVFTFSEDMKAKRQAHNPETHVVLPAGDVALYSKAARAETVAPDDLAALPRPVVGAICVIGPSRFDRNLIVRMAEAHPEWSLALLGPVRGGIDLTPLAALPNVHLMGNRKREEMPNYLKGMDVAIIPYALNEATRHIYPMKTQEYLAGGKPVVAPRLPACAGLEEAVYFADDIPGFIALTERALAEDTPDKAAVRRQVAAQNGWEQRLATRLRLIEPLLQRHRTSRAEHRAAGSA